MGLERALPPLESYLKDVTHLHKQEEQGVTKSSFKYKYITEINASSRLLVAPGIKVKLYINGQKRDLGPIKMFFNPYDLSKGAKSKEAVLQKFFDLVNLNQNVTDLFGIKASKVYVKRAFFIDGRELKDIHMLSSDQELWLSLGESFFPVKSKSFIFFMFNLYDRSIGKFINDICKVTKKEMLVKNHQIFKCVLF